MTGLLVLLGVLAAAGGFGLYRHLSDGRVRDVSQTAAPRLGSAELGSQLGSKATLVQFSSAFCAPCRATRVILTDVSRIVPGVNHVEIDAESHLDLVREFDITRTPSVLVLDGDGVVRHRVVGQPRKDQVIAALGATVA